MKRQPTKSEKIFAYEATNKGVISKIYKQLMQDDIKKIKEWTGDLNRHLSKEETDGHKANEKLVNITNHSVQFSEVHSLSRVRLFVTPWTTARQASLSITNSRSLPKWISTESVMPSSHLILCRILLLPPIPPSIRVFSNSSHEVAKVLQFQLQHQSFQWTPRTDLL